MNILFSISRLGIGGIQTFVRQLANHLNENKAISVSVFCYYPELSSIKSEYKMNDDIKIYNLTKSKILLESLNKLSSFVQNIWPQINIKHLIIRTYYLQIVKRNNIDLVHSNIHITDELAIGSKVKYNIPFLTTAHGSYDEDMPNEAKIELMKKLATYCDMYVYMAEKNLINFKKKNFHLDRKMFIPYGFASEYKRYKLSARSNKLKFCMIARGARDKGWHQLSDAANFLRAEGFIFELHIVGDGPMVNDLFSNRENDEIYFYGALDDPLKVIEKCDIGILPTFHPSETMPYTIIEYLYLSKPVISTDLGSIKWMIAYNGELAGELIALNKLNEVNSNDLANKMKRYLTTPEKVKQDARIATKAFDKFSIEKCSENYTNLYRNLIQN